MGDNRVHEYVRYVIQLDIEHGSKTFHIRYNLATIIDVEKHDGGVPAKRNVRTFTRKSAGEGSNLLILILHVSSQRITYQRLSLMPTLPPLVPVHWPPPAW